MQYNTKNGVADNRIDIDKESIIRGILRQWWVIVLLTAGTFFLSYVYLDSQYVPQYTTSTTFIVTQKSTSSTTYADIQSAKDTAGKFTQILNSNVLQKKVAEELGIPSLNAKVNAKVISETNLIVLSVTAGSAYQSFQILQSMLDNHTLVSRYLLDDVLMSMIQPPAIPMGAINPRNTTRSAIMVTMLTFVVLLVVFGGLGLLRDTIKSGTELKKKLDASLLGIISYEYKYKTLKSFFRKDTISMLINNPILSYRYMENYQLLAARIRSRMKREGHKVLLITSVMENEGKSTVVANLAYSMASSGDKVLLIDCDMRKPAQYKIYDISKEEVKSLGNALKGKENIEELFVELEGGVLTGIFNTEYQKRSTEIVDNGVLQHIIEKAKEEYDFIIIDSSPMALVADAEAISKYADASALVVKQDYVLTKDLNDTIDILNMQKAKLIGCILNGVRQGFSQSKSEYGQHTHKKHHTHYSNGVEEK